MSNGNGGIGLLSSAQLPCAYCGNPMHSAAHHPILEALNRQSEMLDRLAGTLVQQRYRLAQETTEDGTGKATVLFDNFPGGVNKVNLVERVTVWTNSTGTPTVGIYVIEGTPGPFTRGAANQLVCPALNARDLVDYTNVPVQAAEEVNPFLVKGGETCAFQWAALSAGARCVARIQYRVSWQDTAP